MQGGIAQTIGLVFAANARRRGLAFPRWPDASIYQFCNRVGFAGRKRAHWLGPAATQDLPDPNAWLDTLPGDMRGARLRVVPRNDPNISDRNSVGFANGGPIFLAEIAAGEAEAWYGAWEVTDRGAADRRIWSVSYRNVPDAPTGIEIGSERAVRDGLAAALEEALGFNNAQSLGFEAAFVAAQAALLDPTPLAGFYHADIVPVGLLQLGVMQIFAAAAKAWVFGGMGSWNDVGFSGTDQETYLAVSDRLFWAIIQALVFAAQASSRE